MAPFRESGEGERAVASLDRGASALHFGLGVIHLLTAIAVVAIGYAEITVGLLYGGVGMTIIGLGLLRWRGAIVGPRQPGWEQIVGPPTGLRVAIRGIGIVFGLAFLILTTWSLSFVEPSFGQFDLGQQIARGIALACGVVLVVTVLVELVPLSLILFEQRTFVSFVSARLVRATKSGFLTIISLLSILGVAVSSFALCTVTSVMGGFGYDLKRKILGNTAHIKVDVGPNGFDAWEPLLAEVRAQVEPQGGAATAVVAGDAMASSMTNTAGLQVRGIDPKTIGDVIKLKQNIEIGSFDFIDDPKRLLKIEQGTVIGRGSGGQLYFKGPGLDDSYGPDGEPLEDYLPKKRVYPAIIIGRELAKSLHVMLGDEITLLSPIGELGPAGIMPKSRKFRVGGIFYSGMYEYDASHAYMLIDHAQKFFSREDRVSTIDIRVPVPERVELLRPGVDTAVAVANGQRPPDDALRVRDWKQMNKNLFAALKLERIAIFVILTIAILVASFCIICTLLLMVTEKQREIAVLKALGSPDRAIMKIFMLEGVIIGGIGTVLGVAVALAACLGLSWTGIRLDPEVYYIDRLPVNVDPADYALVAIAAMVICTLATIYPAIAAARVKPVEGLRYE